MASIQFQLQFVDREKRFQPQALPCLAMAREGKAHSMTQANMMPQRPVL